MTKICHHAAVVYLGQHVGEASANTDTGVVGDASGGGRAVAERDRAA